VKLRRITKLRLIAFCSGFNTRPGLTEWCAFHWRWRRRFSSPCRLRPSPIV